MSGLLEEIIADKRVEVAEKKIAAPIEQLARETARRDIRDFRAAISKGGGVGVISELKARTPTIDRFTQSGRLEELAANCDLIKEVHIAFLHILGKVNLSQLFS